MIDSVARAAAILEADLRDRVFPYWRDSIDHRGGGYRPREAYPSTRERLRGIAHRARRALTAVARRRPLLQPERHVVTQSRILWTLALAHRLGYGDAGVGYRRAADHGYRFLTTRLHDPRHGGYLWRTDPRGRVLDPGKRLYGQAFALFALVEFHRATNLAEPLDHARELFRVVQEKMRDEEHGGWIEHFTADFRPSAPDAFVPGMPAIGLKSANAHLHWIEALSELLDVTGAPDVRTALEEALRVSGTFFFPLDPTMVRGFRARDWKPAPDPRGEIHSYGHSVEFAWLELRAHEVLGRTASGERFDALVRHALKWGFDPVRGGFYDAGPHDGSATHRDKIWWVQAEGLAALCSVVSRRHDPAYERALDRLLEWILERQRMPNGLWVPRVEAGGRRRSIFAPGAWKGGYHEVRAIVKLIEASGGRPLYDARSVVTPTAEGRTSLR